MPVPAALRRLRAALLLVAAVASAAPAAQERVLLRIAPQVGDTIQVRLDQEMELQGVAKLAGGDSARTMRTSLRAFTRAAVLDVHDEGAIVLALTDSVLAAGGTGQWRRQRLREGSRMTLRVAPDGGTTVLDGGAAASPGVHAIFAGMPSLLPREAVAVGASWTRAMQLPRVDGGGRREVSARIRLDSLSGDRSLAYLSMTATIVADGGVPRSGRITTRDARGGIVGSMVLDRARGWLAELRSVTTSDAEVAVPGAADPVKVRTRITQLLRTVPRKPPAPR